MNKLFYIAMLIAGGEPQETSAYFLNLFLVDLGSSYFLGGFATVPHFFDSLKSQKFGKSHFPRVFRVAHDALMARH